MAGRGILLLIVFVALTKHGLSEEVNTLPDEIKDTNKSPDEVGNDGVVEGVTIGKRTFDTADHIVHRLSARLNKLAVFDVSTSSTENSKNCRNGQTVYDECGRRCTCDNGKLVSCCRLRKEFTSMSYEERVRYINTVKTASTNPAYKTEYDNLLTMHKTLFCGGIHQLDFFLPWHRWYILQYENLLRQIDCRVTVPYWNWVLAAGNPFSSILWSDGADGIGGDGNGVRNCVSTGPFQAEEWSLPTSAGGGCLQREFDPELAEKAIAVAANVIADYPNSSEFYDFEMALREGFHDDGHCAINGTMCSTDSATAPEFFLHHGFVDKIWWDWQNQSYANMFNTYFQTQTCLMPSTSYRSRDFLDLNNQPDNVCAEYVNAPEIFRGWSSSHWAKIRWPKLPPLSAKATKLFRVSPAEQRRLKDILAKMQRKFSKREMQYLDSNGIEAV